MFFGHRSEIKFFNQKDLSNYNDELKSRLAIEMRKEIKRVIGNPDKASLRIALENSANWLSGTINQVNTCEVKCALFYLKNHGVRIDKEFLIVFTTDYYSEINDDNYLRKT